MRPPCRQYWTACDDKVEERVARALQAVHMATGLFHCVRLSAMVLQAMLSERQTAPMSPMPWQAAGLGVDEDIK